MGSFFIDLLSFDHEVAVYEKDAKRLRFTYNCYRFTKMEEIEMFRPELVINAVTVKYTMPAFEEVLPHLSNDCIISDIASVKTGLQEFYDEERLPLREHAPDVWSDLCQSEPALRGECGHHQGGRLYGQDILQGPLPEVGTEPA